MKKKNNMKEMHVYDNQDTTAFINKEKRMTLKDIGFNLPQEAPTKVISMRMPTALYNLIRAYSTNNDIPYQAYIKYLLAEGVKKNMPLNRHKKKK